MRIVYSAAVFAALCLPVSAQTEQRLTVSGVSAAGLCAAAMEFVAGARSATGAATPRELERLQKIRETLLGLPQFPRGEVEAYAEAWSERMAENVNAATSAAHLKSIAEDIGKRAIQCQQGMVQEVNNATGGGSVPQAAQPYTTVPLPAQ